LRIVGRVQQKKPERKTRWRERLSGSGGGHRSGWRRNAQEGIFMCPMREKGMSEDTIPIRSASVRVNPEVSKAGRASPFTKEKIDLSQ